MVARWWAVALVLAVSAPTWAETPQQHVAAARAAEKRSEWRKALREWQAAYRLEINPEYLIAIGDAYAQLGNKAEARKQYDAYLADPLALPANAARVKGKIAALVAPAGGAMALDLPAPDAKGKQGAAAPPLPPVHLPSPPPPGTAKSPDVALALPELPKPGAAPGAKGTAPAPLPLPGLDVPALPTVADAGKKPAAAPAAAPAKPAQTIAATTPPPAATPAVAKTPIAPSASKAPSQAIAAVETPRPTPTAERSGGAQRAIAWVAAGVAVAALGGGALAYTKASSAQSDLTGKVHSGAEAQSLLEQEKQNKTLSFVGLAGGLVAAGIAVALFTF